LVEVIFYKAIIYFNEVMHMNTNNPKFGGTIRFKEIMKELNKHLDDLSNLVITMIQNGNKALVQDDEELFKELEEELKEVHDHCYAIDETVMSSIALHQPFAKDLRFILSTIKVTNEIHRSAHDAVHIANSSEFINKGENKGIVKRIEEIAIKASSMFKDSIDAFRNQKELNIKKWTKFDDEVDKLHADIISDVSDLIEKDATWSRAGVSLILTSRYIERIADHACNIVEESNYVVTGKRVKIE